ncbi:Htur_1727 family rSAM-partnered candidate RiPP [Natronomonas sp.]|uniref:Htur_1727 family rSAM-partnered candidate RiPP n=1 Tax=Natronomonas sp. TaxID=2184060 RepID=UPI002FC309E4
MSNRVERAVRNRVDVENRAPASREWEVFVREEFDSPLQHVGSVRAPDDDAAYELASKLFAWFADDLWICPADSVSRYTTHDLADDTETKEPPAGDEPRNREWS